MDHLILIAVAAELDRELTGAALRDFRQETANRFRAVFVSDDRGHVVSISLRPEAPWIGRGTARRAVRRDRTSAFAATVLRSLDGAIVERVTKLAPDRTVRVEFGDAHAVVVELATHGANLILLDGNGRVVVSARHPRSQRERVMVGEPYRPSEAPASRADPGRVDPAWLDRAWAGRMNEGLEPARALRAVLLGVHEASAGSILEEAGRHGNGPGEVLVERVRRLGQGLDAPVIERPTNVEGIDPERARLLPWEPDTSAPDGTLRWRAPTAAATAGTWYESLEERAWEQERATGLLSILRREIRRLERASSLLAHAVLDRAQPCLGV